MSAPIRVAVIGGGFGQQVHVPALRRDGRASVELICVSSEPRAAAIAERLGVGRASGNWRAVVTDPSIDAVAISVPPLLQADIAVAAAAAGKHVFAEKPLALHVADAARMSEAVQQAGVAAAVDFEFRELPAFQRARSLITEGAVGRLRHVYLTWHVETFAYRAPQVGRNWKRDVAAGGGTLNLFGSHAVDTIAWLLGPVRRIAGRLLAAQAGEAEARVDACLELASGLPVTMSLASDASLASVHRLEVFGDDGAIVLENRTHDYANGFTLTLSRRDVPPASLEVLRLPEADGRIAAVGGVVRRFLDAVNGAPATAPSFGDGLAAQHALDALRVADRTGTWQTLS